jgi:putative ABC transport system permease protein
MFSLVWTNFKRKKMRTALTMLSIVVAFVLFGILAAAWHGFASGIKNGSSTLIVFNRVSRFHGLPLAYRNKIGTVDGMRQVSYGVWFGGYYQDRKNRMNGFAVDAANYLSVQPFSTVPPAQKSAWQNDRTGIIVGEALMKRYGWHLDQRIPVRSSLWRSPPGGDAWQFTIDGIAHSTVAGQPAEEFLLHYQYLNQSAPAGMQNTVSYFDIRIASPAQAARISEAIDNLFRNSAAQTHTQTTAAVAQGFADQFANMGKIVLAVAGAAFFGLLLLTGNVHAQSVRERFSEWATLKALGYPNRTVWLLVTGEALLVMAIGGVIGLAIAKIIMPAIGAMVAAFLPGFYLTGEGMAFGLLLALIMGVMVATIPAIQVARLRIAPTLRRI